MRSPVGTRPRSTVRKRERVETTTVVRNDGLDLAVVCRDPDLDMRGCGMLALEGLDTAVCGGDSAP
jgi:hypothetical protein